MFEFIFRSITPILTGKDTFVWIFYVLTGSQCWLSVLFSLDWWLFSLNPTLTILSTKKPQIWWLIGVQNLKVMWRNVSEEVITLVDNSQNWFEFSSSYLPLLNFLPYMFSSCLSTSPFVFVLYVYKVSCVSSKLCFVLFLPACLLASSLSIRSLAKIS